MPTWYKVLPDLPIWYIFNFCFFDTKEIEYIFKHLVAISILLRNLFIFLNVFHWVVSMFLADVSVQFTCSVLSDSLWPHGLQDSLSITNSQSWLKLMSFEFVMPSNHPILCHPLLLPSIFPSIRVFSNESVLHIRWPEWCLGALLWWILIFHCKYFSSSDTCVLFVYSVFSNFFFSFFKDVFWVVKFCSSRSSLPNSYTFVEFIFIFF